jgi:NTP pyrophosphatase (non-canonical NTP hydrolase)
MAQKKKSWNLFSSFRKKAPVLQPMEQLIGLVSQWHRDRNLIKGSTDKDQVLKLIQELGELSDSICKGKDIKDDIGDMLVVMINIVERNKITLDQCLAEAYLDIKDRKGRMVGGVFVKRGFEPHQKGDG